MSPAPSYTEYHPKWYRSRVSTYWWTRRWPYLKFILRELSSISVAYFVVVLLLLIRAVKEGPEAYAAFLQGLRAPLLLRLNVISLLFVLFHTITWFNLAPKAMAVRVRGKRVPALMMAAPNYAAWLVVSALVIWLL